MAPESISVIFILTTICDVLFLLYLPVGRIGLYKTASAFTSRWLAILKAVIGVSLAILVETCLVWRLRSPLAQHDALLEVYLGISGPAALALGALLYLEHGRSSMPSDLASIYLVVTSLLDFVALTAPVSTTASLVRGPSAPLLARFLFHVLLLALEYFGPRKPLDADLTEKSPEEQSGILSRLVFGWINPILREGYQNILVHHDLPHLSKDIRPGGTREKMLQAWSERKKPETRYTLALALFRCLRRPFLGAILPRLCLTIFQYSQPMLIKQSIRYVTIASSSDVPADYGYWLVLSAVIIYTGLTLSSALYRNRLNRLTIMTRSALVGLIHDKTMHLPSAAYDNGEAVTLMSTDASSLDGVPTIFHETWAYSMDVIIGIVLLAGEVGWVWLLPMSLIFVSSRVSRYVAMNLRSRQKAWNEATQRRVAAITSMLASIKGIKMLGFQHHLARRAQVLREEELQAASRVRWMNVYYNASANAVGIFSPALTIILFAVVAATRGQKLDTETAFTTTALLSMVTHPANMIMTYVPRAVAAFAGFDRIQSYLLRPSLHDDRKIQGFPEGHPLDLLSDDLQLTTSSFSNGHSTTALRIRDLSIGDKQPSLLSHVNITVRAGSLVMISGPVGSGKSTLLRAVLGEVAPTHGTVELSTRRIGYCAQRPWLPSGSIREVISGAAADDSREEDDENWYREVVEACCLGPDLDALPDADGTQVGSGGLNLSGGQRQRVTLARALFARCEIALLDDILSALDGETENRVFERVFGHEGLLRRSRTTVVLVTNSTQFFSSANHIVILGAGGVKEQGPWEAIVEKSAAILKFIPSSHHDVKTGTSPADLAKLSAQLRARDEAAVDLARKTGDIYLYNYYFRSIGLVNLAVNAACTALYGIFIIAPQPWLRLWTETGGNIVFYVCGLLFFAFMAWSSTSLQMWSTVIKIAPRSGLRLHQRLLDNVTGASLAFFSDNDSGSILNRFSQDMQLIDKQLPTATAAVITQMSKLLMQITLLLSTQKLLAISLPPCMLVVYFVQKVYLRTSRQLRFLELETRAAVFSSFLESVEGIETIRSFGWRDAAVGENVARLETAQRPEFLLMCLQRWLNIVLDLMSAAIATGVIAIAVLLRGRVSGGQLGVALNVMLVTNTTVLRLVAVWTTLEVSLGAVSRLKMLERNAPQEEQEDARFEAPDDWPQKGAISFTDVTASYGNDAVALTNFTLTVSPGQRVILCGRTGSGKSSVLLALLRILDVESGEIRIDGVNIANLPRDLLRERVFITVSQDALLLSSETLRFNLDPDGLVDEGTLISALGTTGLWPYFRGDTGDGYGAEEEYHEHPVLDRKMTSFNALSVGQCQLFAICRAVVRADWLRRKGARPVILLDEVTSSLDSAVEASVHRLVDQEFSDRGHTVIVVSHRLGGLVDDRREGDVVVWMRDGRVHEVSTDLRSASRGVDEG
ncbi:ABC transporter FUM19 [Echria macrotheca]|uniref:ABC transporter FUM19 n=1 Tax=Echria macrotheca TaxID=438768 RepID=A0AAJ0BF31_9PEZI|nr:ABC transporter FUM19 [Echria macrotheca]